MKTITRKCQYCSREMRSLYQKQIDYNMETHEKYCSMNPENKESEKDELPKYKIPRSYKK